MILGITGGIAAGKSTITEFFIELGAAVVSADELARAVVKPGQPTLAALRQRFGATIIAAGGELDRARLAELVFADPVARQDMNRIIHPAIAALAEQTLKKLKEENYPLIVYEAPLLYEAGAQNRVDKVLVIRIDPEQQHQRLRQRDGFDDEEIKARIAAQMPQEEKEARADYIIDNSGSQADTRTQVKDLFRNLCN